MTMGKPALVLSLPQHKAMGQCTRRSKDALQNLADPVDDLSMVPFSTPPLPLLPPPQQTSLLPQSSSSQQGRLIVIEAPSDMPQQVATSSRDEHAVQDLEKTLIALRVLIYISQGDTS